MKKQVRGLVKKFFALLGLHVRRINPADNNHRWLERYGIKTVIDVGANVGIFAKEITGILPDATIISFEPLADCYSRLLEAMAWHPRFRAFKCALGEREETVVMHHNEFSASSSILSMADLHKTAFPKTQNVSDETVDVRTLDGVLVDVECEDNLLVKIDVQGYETNVILGGKKTISRAAVVIAETTFRELYDGQPLFEDVYEMLKELGFRYVGSLGPQLMSPTDGSTLQADSLFINTRFDAGR